MTTYAGKEQAQARQRAAGKLPSQCPRCGGLVTAGMNWHADHWPISRAEARAAGIPIGQLEVWPAHASCNEAANGSKDRRRASTPRPITPVVRPSIGGME